MLNPSSKCDLDAFISELIAGTCDTTVGIPDQSSNCNLDEFMSEVIEETCNSTLLNLIQRYLVPNWFGKRERLQDKTVVQVTSSVPKKKKSKEAVQSNTKATAKQDHRGKKSKNNVTTKANHQTTKVPIATNDSIQLPGTWVECSQCRQWRFLAALHDPSQIDADWWCGMHPSVDVWMSQSEHMSPCQALPVELTTSPTTETTTAEDVDYIYTSFAVGSVVWARMTGYPEWPAMIDFDDCGKYADFNAQSRQVTHCQVVFLDPNRLTRKRIRIDKLRKFTSVSDCDLANVRPSLAKHIRMAAYQAELALKIPIKERISMFGYSGRKKLSKEMQRKTAKLRSSTKSIVKAKLKTKDKAEKVTRVKSTKSVNSVVKRGRPPKTKVPSNSKVSTKSPPRREQSIPTKSSKPLQNPSKSNLVGERQSQDSVSQAVVDQSAISTSRIEQQDDGRDLHTATDSPLLDASITYSPSFLLPLSSNVEISDLMPQPSACIEKQIKDLDLPNTFNTNSPALDASICYSPSFLLPLLSNSEVMHQSPKPTTRRGHQQASDLLNAFNTSTPVFERSISCSPSFLLSSALGSEAVDRSSPQPTLFVDLPTKSTRIDARDRSITQSPNFLLPLETDFDLADSSPLSLTTPPIVDDMCEDDLSIVVNCGDATCDMEGLVDDTISVYCYQNADDDQEAPVTGQSSSIINRIFDQLKCYATDKLDVDEEQVIIKPSSPKLKYKSLYDIPFHLQLLPTEP